MILDREFLGFARANGTVGVRNHCLIMVINGLTYQAARRAADQLPGCLFSGIPYGRGQVGADAKLISDTIHGLCLNPNVGAVVIVGADDASVDRFMARLSAAGQSVKGVSLQSVGEDSRRLSEHIVGHAAQALKRLSQQPRESVDAAKLCVALQCGHSDFSSGLIANPVVGTVIDRLVARGGAAMFGETVEWLGGEHNLTRRAATSEVASEITRALDDRVRYALERNEDVTRHNPLPQNIAGGLTTTEEKALGAIAKGGSAEIRGVLPPAGKPPGPGLFLMDTPFFSPESITCLVAGGAQITLFTTGPGNSYCSLIAPTIKISANIETCEQLTEQIDVPLAGVQRGEISEAQAADELQRQILAVASGALTFGEILGEGTEVIGRLGASL